MPACLALLVGAVAFLDELSEQVEVASIMDVGCVLRVTAILEPSIELLGIDGIRLGEVCDDSVSGLHSLAF